MAAVEATTAQGIGSTVPGQDRTETVDSTSRPWLRWTEDFIMDAMVYPSLPGLKDADLFRQAALIGGQWLLAASGQTVAVTNPATGAVIGTVPDVSRKPPPRLPPPMQRFQGWRKLPHATRAAALERAGLR